MAAVDVADSTTLIAFRSSEIPRNKKTMRNNSTFSSFRSIFLLIATYLYVLKICEFKGLVLVNEIDPG